MLGVRAVVAVRHAPSGVPSPPVVPEAGRSMAPSVMPARCCSEGVLVVDLVLSRTRCRNLRPLR
eukprot:6041912-Heterocapsa_arctica.AAC.1